MAKRASSKAKAIVESIGEKQGTHRYEFAVLRPPVVRDRASLIRLIDQLRDLAELGTNLFLGDDLRVPLLSDLETGLVLIRDAIRDGEVKGSADCSYLYTEMPALAAEACRRLKGMDGAEDSIQFLIDHVLVRVVERSRREVAA